MRGLIGGLLLSLISLTASSKDYVVSNDHGGLMRKYALFVQKAKIYGTKIRFRGMCGSACTLYLSLPERQLCLEPGAFFVFHAAHSGSSRYNRAATEYLWKSYPFWTQTYIIKRGGLTHREIVMPFSYARKYIQPC